MTDQELFKAYERQQKEINDLMAKQSTPPKKKKGRDGSVMDSDVGDLLSQMAFSGTGVKISMETPVETGKVVKEEDIQKQLLQQTQMMEKERERKKELEALELQRKLQKERSLLEKKTRIAANRRAGNNHTKHITRQNYMFHIFQPNLMSQMFDLLPDRRLLFGGYDADLKRVEEEYWKRPLFRGCENLILPDLV